MSGFGEGGFGDGNYGGYLGNLGSSPPQQFTSLVEGGFGGPPGFGDDGFGDSLGVPTIEGVIDGVNSLFSVGVVLRRAQIWKNGRLQTLNVDCVFGTRFVRFLPGHIPQFGDSLLIFGWV